MFSFTSMGAKVDHQVNARPGPYVYKISGQNYHRMGSLLPQAGNRPMFAQLYIFDTENEVSNRVRSVNFDNDMDIDQTIVQSLIGMFDQNNQIVKAFRMARDRFEQDNIVPIRLKLTGRRPQDTMQYDLPSNSEIAGLMVGDFGQYDRQRDIIVEHQNLGLKRISDLHPSFMSLQYPILFPYGEDGYMIKIPYQQSPLRKKGAREFLTMREFYAYRIQQRHQEGQTLIKGGRLFQQYIVDAFTCVEGDRLDYIRRKQSDLRSDLYGGIRDAVDRGDTDGSSIGKRIILPASFTGGPRYMFQNYQDAMAICRSYSHPDLFLTFTCNAKWIEIQNALSFVQGQRPDDRPDIVSRVFKMKLDNLITYLKKSKPFGVVVAGTTYLPTLKQSYLSFIRQLSQPKKKITSCSALHNRVPKTWSTSCSHSDLVATE